MIRALIQILKGTVCVFVLLYVGRWMALYFGFTPEIFIRPDTGHWDALLITISFVSASFGYSLGVFSGFIWGRRGQKECARIHYDSNNHKISREDEAFVRGREAVKDHHRIHHW